MSIVDTLHLIGSPDTNKVMMGELSRLARRALSGRLPEPRKQGRGGLLYPFDPDLAYLAVSYHRTATRVLWDLYESSAARLEPLYAELVADVCADSRQWFWDGARISVSARNVAAFAAGERQIVGTVKNAIVDGAGERGVRLRVDPDTPDIYLTARMHDDTLGVSIDLAGASLSRRGYRTEHGAAPLREHLAAVMCMLARYDARSEILVDPMCGAGTICIEAVQMGQGAPLVPPSGQAPRAGREPAMVRLPDFRGRAGTALEPLFGDTRPMVIGGDRDPDACAAARANIAAAGLGASPIIWQGDFRELGPERVLELASREGSTHHSGVIISNPPYGHRLGDDELLDLYADLGRYCALFRGWRAAFLVANDDFERAFGRRPRIRKPLKNGPLRASFYLYDF